MNAYSQHVHTVTCPLVTNGGTPTDRYSRTTREALNALGVGFTAHHATGSWQGKREPVVVYTIYVEHAAALTGPVSRAAIQAEAEQWARDLAVSLRAAWGPEQEAIQVTTGAPVRVLEG